MVDGASLCIGGDKAMAAAEVNVAAATVAVYVKLVMTQVRTDASVRQAMRHMM